MDRRIGDVGGTSGGLGSFVLGLALTLGGGYLLLNQVSVTSHAWYLGGYDMFGVSLLPLLFGIAMLFFNGRNPLAWLLVIAGLGIILFGIISNLSIFIRPTSLFAVLIMLGCVFGGLGLVARALR
jgi:hypothetical protein